MTLDWLAVVVEVAEGGGGVGAVIRTQARIASGKYCFTIFKRY